MECTESRGGTFTTENGRRTDGIYASVYCRKRWKMEKQKLLRKMREAEKTGDTEAANQILAELAELQRKRIARVERFIKFTEEYSV